MSLIQREYEREMTALLRVAEELAGRHLKNNPTEPRTVRVGWFRHETARELEGITFTFNPDGESELQPLYINDKKKLVYWVEGYSPWVRPGFVVLTPDTVSSWTLKFIIYDLGRGRSWAS